MTEAAWNRCLARARAAHEAHAELSAFCPFPDDVHPQPVNAHHINAAALFAGDASLVSHRYTSLCAAARSLGDHAAWRETYKETSIGDDFLDRFGCYSLVGQGGAFHSAKMWCWFVYMPAGLWYPFHHHPAEEAYLVIAGGGRFLRAGKPDAPLTEGMLMVHQANEPHALETTDEPILAYVVWRNGFDTAPVLTDMQMQPAEHQP